MPVGKTNDLQGWQHALQRAGKISARLMISLGVGAGLTSGLAGCGMLGDLPGLRSEKRDGPPLSGQPSLALARTALASGAADLALNASTMILSRDPGNAAAHLVQADALTALGRVQEAQAGYLAALALQPDSIEARIGLGRIALASDAAAAERLFLEVLQQEPRNAVALNNLGIARDLLGRHVEAQAAYRQAIGLSPAMRAAQVNLALSLALSGKASEGAAMLRPLALDQGVSTRMKETIAAVAALAQDPETAEALLRTSLNPEQVREALEAYDALRRSTPP